ncbi:hypothetical protein JTB14_012393 [Gonioctena quinquepunctata]|nr:hypothetical protein JTB14_012393 [Gonioctena quinquepunctata]
MYEAMKQLHKKYTMEINKKKSFRRRLSEAEQFRDARHLEENIAKFNNMASMLIQCQLRESESDEQTFSSNYDPKTRSWLVGEKIIQKTTEENHCVSMSYQKVFGKKTVQKASIEVRSIEHAKNLNKGLENKIISLQQKIDELNKTNNEMKNYQNEVLELK